MMIATPHVADRVLDFLVGLGDTGDEVAGSLRTMGVRGTRGARTCPIARAVKAAFPDAGWVSIGLETFSVGPIGDVARRAMPPGARGFLEGFQAEPCEYPDLWRGKR